MSTTSESIPIDFWNFWSTTAQVIKIIRKSAKHKYLAYHGYSMSLYIDYLSNARYKNVLSWQLPGTSWHLPGNTHELPKVPYWLWHFNSELTTVGLDCLVLYGRPTVTSSARCSTGKKYQGMCRESICEPI